MATVLGLSRDKQANGSMFITYPPHVPSQPQEKFRIYNNRGEIRESSNVPRIFLRARMYPGLKISRTIGDLIPHQIGVISEPQFNTIELQPTQDKFIIMATDGLWDHLNPEDVFEIINDMTQSQRETQGEIIRHILQKVKDAAQAQEFGSS